MESYTIKKMHVISQSVILAAMLLNLVVCASKDADYMLYPRLLANAEIGWTTQNDRNYSEFIGRLPAQFARLNPLGA